jgi:hypothetical protein
VSIITAPGHEFDRASPNLSRAVGARNTPCGVDGQHPDVVQYGPDYAGQIPDGFVEDPARGLVSFPSERHNKWYQAGDIRSSKGQSDWATGSITAPSRTTASILLQQTLYALLRRETTTAAPMISALPKTVLGPHASPRISTPSSAPTSGSRFKKTPAPDAGIRAMPQFHSA